MKTKLSPAAVGMFVLGAALLLVVGFISFGGSNIFAKPARFRVFFDESVSGLDPGAAVKFTGVRIGRVAAVNVRYFPSTRRALVETICEIDRNVVTDGEGEAINITNPEELQRLVEKGLRARLTLQGITGLLFVELSLQDPQEYPAKAPLSSDDGLLAVPAIPSPISELQNSVVEIVASLKQVDFAALGKDLRTLLQTTNRKVGELDAAGLASRVTAAATAVENFVGSPAARDAFANLNATLTDARTALAHLDERSGPVSEELRATLIDARSALKSLDAAAATTRGFVQEQSRTSEDLAGALRQISDAAESLQRLADFLSRNPNALLVGKKRE